MREVAATLGKLKASKYKWKFKDWFGHKCDTAEAVACCQGDE